MTSSTPRRRFLQSALGTAITTSTFPGIVGAAPDRPMNVLLVMCDQMRGDAMGWMGNPNARTPHLDALSRESLRFTHAFCNSPVCVPSRMATFAGRYPHQTGRMSNRPWGDPELAMPDTLGDYFLSRGYRCGWIGKNHTYMDDDLVSEFHMYSKRAREPFRRYGKHTPPHWHSHTYLPDELCHPRMNTDEAISFMKKASSDQPFFLNINYFDPHPPYMAPDEYVARYCTDDIQLPERIQPRMLSSRLQDFSDGFRMEQVNDWSMRETMKFYHASVEWGVDAQVGRLWQTLIECNLLDNTIVIFTSDHGDFMGDYHLVRKGMFLYDALLHVPLFIRIPGSRPTTNASLVQLLDLYPTLVDLTDGEIPAHCMGRSLTPLIRGESDRWDDPLFTTSAYGQVEPVIDPRVERDDDDETPLHTRVMTQSMQPEHETRMVRTRDYKFILNEDDPPELYAYSANTGEQENVAGQASHASVRRELESTLEQWRTETETR